MGNNHLLIVEDSPKDRQVLSDTLKDLYYIYEAKNWIEAVEHINENNVDLVIMSYELPDIDGIDAFIDIKTLRPSLPVIFTSSYLIGEIILKAFRLGVRDFFKKPFNTEEVSDTINLLLEYKEKKEETRRNILLDRYINKQPVDMPIHAGIEKAKIFIEENYNKSISLQHIANKASLSRHHCSRSFKKEMGISFSKYLTRLRVEKAKDLLRGKRMPIAKISDLVGYNDITYFERVFKKTTGLTPSTYRNKVFRSSSLK